MHAPKHCSTFFVPDDQVSQHAQWILSIRSKVWVCIEFEDHLPPTWEALWWHWLYCCWVTDFWAQACNNAYNLLLLSEYGWKVNRECLEVNGECLEVNVNGELVNDDDDDKLALLARVLVSAISPAA